jgi:hypothetical protein
MADGSQDIWGLVDPDKAILPLPVRQVLLLAIHGWAVETNTPQYGLPALPDRRAWLPVFIRLLHRPDWREEMQRLCLLGLGAAAPDLQDTITRASHTPRLHAGMVEALAILVG